MRAWTTLAVSGSVLALIGASIVLNAAPGPVDGGVAGVGYPAAGAADLAVLGYMAELGEHERAGHEQVGRSRPSRGWW